MHGMYWYLALAAEHVRWLHITVLEMLATGFSTIIFHRMLPPKAERALGSDYMATTTSLASMPIFSRYTCSAAAGVTAPAHVSQ